MPKMTGEEKAEYLEKMKQGRERKQYMPEYLERRRNGEDITFARLMEEKRRGEKRVRTSFVIGDIGKKAFEVPTPLVVDTAVKPDLPEDLLGGDIDDSAETKAEDAVEGEKAIEPTADKKDAPPDSPVATVPEVPSGLKLTMDQARELIKATEEAGGLNATLSILKRRKVIEQDFEAYPSKGRSRGIMLSLNPRDFERLYEIIDFAYENQGQRIVLSQAAKIAIRSAKITVDSIFMVLDALEMEDKRGTHKRWTSEKTKKRKERESKKIWDDIGKKKSRKRRKASKIKDSEVIS